MVLAAGLAATVSFGAAANGWTPSGFPCGPSASSPTGLPMQSERTKFTYLRDADCVHVAHGRLQCSRLPPSMAAR